MFISSLHFPGLVPPCIRTDTASDYRTTFFKRPEVNVPVFCIIKVITHRGRQRLSRERGPGHSAERLHIPAQATRLSCAWQILNVYSLCGAVTDRTGRPQVRPQASPWVRVYIRSCTGSRDRSEGTHTSDHRAVHSS